jgi:tetratricopeptide (TPR) repeat protein
MSGQAGTSGGVPGPVAWPVLSGLMPPVADAYIPRAGSGLALAAGLNPGETVVLVTAGDAARILGGLGGTGKTQCAVAIAGALWERRAVDLLVWVTASSRDAVVTGYAQALAGVGAPDRRREPEAAASRLLAWLAGTGRPWLVVLDDLTDAAVLDGLWPSGASGRLVVTTNRPDTASRARGRVVEVGAFSSRESLDYLFTKLQADRDQWAGALELAAALGFLPIALAQAGAVMAGTGLGCREYLTRIAGQRRLPGALTGTGFSPVAATCALALELAGQLPPAGLARPMLALICLLDPNGIPGAVLTSPASCAFLARFGGPAAVDGASARAAVYALAQLGLVTIDTTSAARTVRTHELVQAVVRQALPGAESGQAARAAADALLQAWPQQAVPAALDQALRDCTARLSQATGALLWAPQCHPVLLRAGQSLDDAGLTGPAITYWQAMTDLSRPRLGAAHPQTIYACERLAAAGEAAGAAGRHADAIPVHERVLAERERGLGPAHPDTLAAQANLARAYSAAGRAGDATRLAERALAECERDQRPGHPGTLAARANLAHAYRAAGRPADALPLYEQILADREQAQGPDHPDTITARANLAAAYRAADRPREAIGAYKRTLADRERVQGPDHPDTITARGNLASACHSARKLTMALPLYERTLADCERVLGPDHPDTLTSQGNLAHAYHTAGRLTEALALFERTLADSERVLGPGHPLTETARQTYQAAAKS